MPFVGDGASQLAGTCHRWRVGSLKLLRRRLSMGVSVEQLQFVKTCCQKSKGKLRKSVDTSHVVTGAWKFNMPSAQCRRTGAQWSQNLGTRTRAVPQKTFHGSVSRIGRHGTRVWSSESSLGVAQSPSVSSDRKDASGEARPLPNRAPERINTCTSTSGSHRSD